MAKNKNDDAWLKERMQAFERSENYLKNLNEQLAYKKKHPYKYFFNSIARNIIGFLNWLFFKNFLIKSIVGLAAIILWIYLLAQIKDHVHELFFILICFVPLIAFFTFLNFRR